MIPEILQKQKEFFESNATKSFEFRLNNLLKLKQLLYENEQLLFDAIYVDFGKSSFDTYATEIGVAHKELNVAIKNLKKWMRKKRVRTNLLNFPARSYILPEPLGNTLIIGAWNYPYLLTLTPVVPAIAAGNTIIIKPSELTLNTSKALHKIINENFPPEYFAVVEGGVEETKELLELKFDKIFFTGSTRVGKIVMQAAAKNLTPVTLELGGKSPAFIFKDANLKQTARRLVWAKFVNAGQSCVAPDYVVIEKEVKNEFIACLKEEINKSYGTFDECKENYTRIVNQQNYIRLQSLIIPEKVVIGGDLIPEKNCITPTVLDEVSWDDKVMEDEIFGPILPIISFTNLDETIKKVKSYSKPLSLYVYTNSRKKRDRILNEISFGGGCVNESLMHLSNPNLPFGGVGDSGMGNYHHEAGFKSFSHYKSILDKPFWLELPIKYSNYSQLKLRLIKFFLD